MCALHACESWDEVASDAEKLPGLRGGQDKVQAPKGPAPAGWPRPSPTEGEARSGTAAPGPSARRVGARVLLGLLRAELLLGTPNPGPSSLACAPQGRQDSCPRLLAEVAMRAPWGLVGLGGGPSWGGRRKPQGRGDRRPPPTRPRPLLQIL